MARPKTMSLLGSPPTREGYDRALPRLESLKREAEFILNEMLATAGVKIHAVESRIKTYESITKKLADHSDDRTFHLRDIVGLRVVGLFKSDLDHIENLLSQNFEVQTKDDKVVSSVDTFGYMSVHYVCRMPSKYRGPRYDQLRTLEFEVQVRTLCMHAWAAISHYLDYKTEWDIPTELKKGLNALSGLFYVADEQYEALYHARELSKVKAAKQVANKSGVTSINLDTIMALARRMFPDREKSDDEAFSSLVRQVLEVGYNSVEEIERDLNAAHQAMLKYELDNYSSERKFTDLGAMRVSLRIVNERLDRVVFRDSGHKYQPKMRGLLTTDIKYPTRTRKR